MDLNIKKTKMQAVGTVKIPSYYKERVLTGIQKVDELFGSKGLPGIIPGTVGTITAKGGCGKTTLMMQVCEALAQKNMKAGIVSGEEAVHQLAYNAQRLNVTKFEIGNLDNIDDVAVMCKEYDMIVIDSFQSMGATEDEDMNTKQLEKHILETIVQAAKKEKCIVIFVMHVTKGGIIKGGSNIIHTVDINLEIEVMDETMREVSCSKNRFGSCGDFSAALTNAGYDFSIDAVDADEEGGTKRGSNRGSEKKELIHQLLQHKRITLEQASVICGHDVQKARFIMSDLKVGNMFSKTGKGNTAVFMRNDDHAAVKAAIETEASRKQSEASAQA